MRRLSSADTLPPDTLPPDTLAPDTLAPDTLAPDTLAPDTLIVLPPKEGFAPGSVGAIGLLVERLARAGAGGLVLGAAGGATFPGVAYEQVRPGFTVPWGLGRAGRYAAGVARVVRRVRPRLVEVHNWPEVALRLRGLGAAVTLILNNDPQTMRGARTVRERARLVAGLAGVAAASEWIRGRLLEGGAGEVAVLPNCIDLPPPPAEARDDVILFAGRVVADKGADAFVAACAEALPQMPGWRAVMIGADRFRVDSPETPFLRALRPAAAAAGVEMRGHQPNDAVVAAMGRAAIVVMPSRWPEPFGLVALEAMAHGAALVCSGTGGLREVAGEAALYADPDRPGALAAAILSLARDPGRRAALAAAGRARAEGFAAPEAAGRLLAFRAAVLAR